MFMNDALSFCHPKLTLKLLHHQAEKTATLLSQIAAVIAQEKLLLEECQEIFQTIPILEVKVRTLDN